MVSMKRAFLVPAIVVLFGVSSDARAQWEFWPEVDVFNRFDSQWRLFSLLSLSHNKETKYKDFQVGTHIEYSMLPLDPLLGAVSADFERYRLLQFRLGYRYAQALGADADEYKEHRIVAEATIRLAITEKILTSDRNAADVRWILGKYSWRYRNRLRVEREFVTDLIVLNPYVSAEIWYDSRYATFNRQVYCVGVEYKVSKLLVLEAYVAGQYDSRSGTPHNNALGLTVNVYD